MTTIITMPFAFIMRIFYMITGSYGVSLLLFALVVKLVMLPFQLKSKKSMVRMGRLSGRQKELEKQYANNKQKYQEEVAKMYQEEGVNPMGGCLWSLIPLFIIWPLYYIIREPMGFLMRLSTETIDAVRKAAEALGYVAKMSGDKFDAYEQINLTQFVSEHWSEFDGKFDGLMNIDFNFLGLNLTEWPWDKVTNFTFEWACIGIILIPIVSGVLSFLLSSITTSSNGQKGAPGMKSMMITMPLMSVYIGFVMPAALGIYWIANSLFSAIQEATLGKYFNEKIQKEEDERFAAREADRKRRMEEAKLRQQEQGASGKKLAAKKPEKKSAAPTTEAGRVEGRPYARGRSYVENRYDD